MSDLPLDDDRNSAALDDVVREAREDLTPSIDDAAFAAMQERIVSRMNETPRMNEAPAQETKPAAAAAARAPAVSNIGSAAQARRSRALGIGAIVLAAAAAIALVTKKDPGAALLDNSVAAMSPAELTAGSLRAAEGAGEVRVGGVPASPGHVLRAGDLLEVEGTRAVLERPRKVMWMVEHGDDGNIARARVKSAGESLVLGLEDGAIEAQVTPVPSGEAFAVDVATPTSLVRVAVHGTHLRVTRVGSHVTIDLSEGVVSIGVPPRTGSTYGTLVTAPSHVEFDAANLDATLRIDHARAAVRAPVTLVSHEPALAAGNGVTARADVPPAAPQVVGAPEVPATVPRPTSVSGGVPRPIATTLPTKIDPEKPVVPAREAIAAAVRDCASARHRPENVRVSVSSSLKLKIFPDGTVDVAQFDPPLLPEIQTCAGTTIYKVKLEDAASGTVTIPIDFTY